MSSIAQYVGVVLLAIGAGLVVGAVLSVVAGVGVGMLVAGGGLVAFGVAAEREVTDGSRTPATRT